MLAALSAAALHLSLAAALVLLGLAAFAGGYSTSLGWALLVGLSAWAYFTGFLENPSASSRSRRTTSTGSRRWHCLAVVGSLLWRTEDRP